MELKYKTSVAAPLLVISLACLVLGVLAGATPATLTGVLTTTASVLMFVKPVVKLNPRWIGMHNLIGMELKRHELRPGNFEVRDNKIFVEGKKRVSLWMLDADEATVRSYLAGS